MLPTPTAQSYGSNQGGAMGRCGPVRYSLQSMAKRGLWPTPTVHGNHNRKGLSPDSGDGLATAVKASVDGGQLNPTWVEWLMGFPSGWLG
jgi:DNA (cytosine-5)-methyltransferase 1